MWTIKVIICFPENSKEQHVICDGIRLVSCIDLPYLNADVEQPKYDRLLSELEGHQIDVDTDEPEDTNKKYRLRKSFIEQAKKCMEGSPCYGILEIRNPYGERIYPK